MTKPKLTIGIPTCNRHAHLVEQIQSLARMAEKYNEVEIIVADNSNPSIQELNAVAISKFKVNRMLHYRHNANLGYHGNIEFLIRAFSGNFLWLLSDDDLALNGSIAVILETIQKYPSLEYLTFDASQYINGEKRNKKYLPRVSETVQMTGAEFTHSHSRSAVFISLNVLSRTLVDRWQCLPSAVMKTNATYHNSFIILGSLRPESPVVVISEPLVMESHALKHMSAETALRGNLDAFRLLSSLNHLNGKDLDFTDLTNELLLGLRTSTLLNAVAVKYRIITGRFARMYISILVLPRLGFRVRSFVALMLTAFLVISSRWFPLRLALKLKGRQDLLQKWVEHCYTVFQTSVDKRINYTNQVNPGENKY